MNKNKRENILEENGIFVLEMANSNSNSNSKSPSRVPTEDTALDIEAGKQKESAPVSMSDFSASKNLKNQTNTTDGASLGNAKKLSHLDGLRGWASFCVFIGHVGTRLCPSIFWSSSPPFYSTASVLSHIFLGIGGFPIVIFFMLSGRVLALSFLKKRDFKRLASSAIRRPFRLVFPVYIALLFYVFFQAGNTFNPNIANANVYVNATSGPVYEWFPLLTDANRVQNISQFLADPITLFIAPYRAPVNPGLSVYWTLPVEFVYSYVVFVMALAASAISHQKWLFYLVVIIFDWLNSINSWLSPFAVGLWIAEVAQTGFYHRIEKGIQGYIVRFLLFAIGFSAVMVDAYKGADVQLWFSSRTFNRSGIMTPHSNPDYNQMLPLTLIVGTCLMLLLETSSWMRFCFGNPIMDFFGRISFGVYLLHPTLVVSLGSFLIAKYYDPAAGYSQNSAIAIVFITLLAAIIPLSWIFYHVADKPSIWIGRQVESAVFATEWSIPAFMGLIRDAFVGIPLLPERFVKYVRYHIAETRAYLARPSKRAHVAVFGLLGFVDLIVLLTFCTMKTSSTDPGFSPTLSGTTLFFKSINNPAWSTNGGWAGVKTLVTLGDSWTDTSFNISSPPTPSNPIGALPLYNTSNYWGVSGTDGPNWVWGLTGQLNRSTILTWNFASAGAIIDSTMIRPFRETVLDMKSQVSTIISTFRGASVSDRDSTLIALMLGGNDVGNTYSPPTSSVIPQGYPLSLLYPELVTIYFNQLGLLYAAGFRNFFLINAPPLDRSPNAVSQGSLPSYGAEIQTWNTLFQVGARNFTNGLCAGCTVYHYDVNSFLTYIMQPNVAATYNVTVVTPTFCEDYGGLLNQPYLYSPNCSAPVNQYFWLNSVHPTWGVMGKMAEDMVAFMS